MQARILLDHSVLNKFFEGGNERLQLSAHVLGPHEYVDCLNIRGLYSVLYRELNRTNMIWGEGPIIELDFDSTFTSCYGV
jgi:hypothetical protein